MTKFKIPKIVGFLLMMAILFGLGYLLPYTIVLGKAGLVEPEVKEQLAIYSDIILFGFALMILFIINFIWKGKSEKYGDNIGLFSKEETIFKDFSYLQLAFLSVIFFSIIFLVANILEFLGTGIFGLRVLPQQFTPFDSLVVSTFQIPIAENFMAGFALGLICLIIVFISVKYNVNRTNYKIYKYSASVIGLALFGYIWHLTAYPNSDIAGLTVAIFWGFGAFISLFTGFFVPFLTMHMANNFFIDFGRLYSSDFVLSTVIGIILLLSIGYFYLYRENLFPIKLKN